MADTLTITGTDLVVKDAAGNQVYPAGVAPPEPGPEPTEKPKLAITTPGGNATNTAEVTIEGTIDLPNVGCDILLDAGPTSFGTFRAGADGHWSKKIMMTTTGTWTITAHASNSHGKTDSNSVIFNVSASGGGGGGGGTDAPPEPVTRISAGASVDSIQSAVTACPAGGSVVLSAGSYNFGGRSVRLKAGACIWADGVCTISGAPGPGTHGAIDGSGLSGWTVGGKAAGQGFVFNGTGMVDATNARDFVVANATWNNLASNGFDGSVVRLGGARGGAIVNCDANGCQGNLFAMYSMDSITVDGCHFADCRQPISYQFGTDGSTGNGMTVINNVFLRTTRACMEMGPDANKQQKMNGLKVNNNWFDDMNPTQDTCDQGASLPISLVATAATNSECKGNYIRRGDRPASVNRPHPAIEFAGSGPCGADNTIDSFKWEGFAYSTGYHYHGNKAFNAPWGFVVGTGGGAGTIEPSQILSSPPAKPPWPTRNSPTIYYAWSKSAATQDEPPAETPPEPAPESQPQPQPESRDAKRARDEYFRLRKRRLEQEAIERLEWHRLNPDRPGPAP
jgi:hypothetical protein